MKLRYDQEDGSLKLLPRNGADEMIIVALLRTLSEGGMIQLESRTGRGLCAEVPESSLNEAPKEVLDLIGILDK